MTTVAGCFASGRKNQRMREPASDFTNDSTQMTATLLEFTGATSLICKNVRVCGHSKVSKDPQNIEARLERTMRIHETESVKW